MGGWIGRWMGGWMDGRMKEKAGLRIAYSNKDFYKFVRLQKRTVIRKRTSLLTKKKDLL